MNTKVLKFASKEDAQKVVGCLKEDRCIESANISSNLAIVDFYDNINLEAVLTRIANETKVGDITIEEDKLNKMLNSPRF